MTDRIDDPEDARLSGIVDRLTFESALRGDRTDDRLRALVQQLTQQRDHLRAENARLKAEVEAQRLQVEVRKLVFPEDEP